MTTSPAVVVTAATIGRGDRYFHFTAPDVASIAVNQPCDLSGGSMSVRPPIYSLPGMYRTCSKALNVAHQSTAAAYNMFVRGLYAGPFHWLPPSTPGEACVGVVVTGVSGFLRVVTAVSYTTRCVSRSSARRTPSLPVVTTRRRAAPFTVVSNIGVAWVTSQSCESFGTSC